jgi:hypothetical protein
LEEAVADPVVFEALREAERTLDQQLRAAEELDDKTEQMITLAVSTLGGEIAILAYVAERHDLGLAVRGAFACALAAAFFALLAFLDAYVGLRKRGHLQAGPSLRKLAEVANDPAWSMDRHLVSVLQGCASYFEANAVLMAGASRARRVGLAALVGSTLIAGFAAIYVLG